MTARSRTEFVTHRAHQRCEYCQMHQALQGSNFHVEHIVPLSAGGTDHNDNFALACPRCNLRKSNRTVAVDPVTGDQTPLFHPRLNRWEEHFYWEGSPLRGQTPTGRATVDALELNHD